MAPLPVPATGSVPVPLEPTSLIFFVFLIGVCAVKWRRSSAPENTLDAQSIPHMHTDVELVAADGMV